MWRLHSVGISAGMLLLKRFFSFSIVISPRRCVDLSKEGPEYLYSNPFMYQLRCYIQNLLRCRLLCCISELCFSG